MLDLQQNCSIAESSSSAQVVTKTYRMARPPPGTVLGVVYDVSNLSWFSIDSTHLDAPNRGKLWRGIALDSKTQAHFLFGTHPSHDNFDQEDIFIRIQYNIKSSQHVDLQFELFPKYVLEENGKLQFKSTSSGFPFVFFATRLSYPSLLPSSGKCQRIFGCSSTYCGSWS